MKGFSKVIIMGNLTRDPELRSTPSGSTVCSFGVAVNRNFKDQSGNQREEVSFFDCSAWGRQGEVINQYLKKGNGILVSGQLRQRSWEDKEGKKRSSVEIFVEDFNFVGGGNRDGGYSDNGSSSSYGGKATAAPANIPDDIPEGEIDLSDVPF